MIPVAGYVVGLAASAVLAVGIDTWVRRHGQGPAARWFRGTLYATLAWALGSALQLLVPGLTAKIAVMQVWAVAAWAAPLLWFVFVVHYTGYEHRLTRRAWLGLGGLFAALAGLSLTNHLHGLVWSGMRLLPDTYAVPVLVVERTAVYWLGLLLSYALVLVSFLLLVRLLLTARRVNRQQVGALVVGMCLPLGLNALSVSSTQHVPALNLTPLGAGIFLVFVGWALFRYQLFGIEPQARDSVLEVIDEGVIVVNTAGYVVDFNDRATSLFPSLADGYGAQLSAVVPSLLSDAPTDGGERFVEDLTVGTDTGERSIRVSVSPLTVAGERRASVLVCQDVTELRTYARDLEQRTEQLDRFAETVSHDLRNPLSVVRGHLELMEATGETSNLPAALDATDRMATIIDDALTLARQGHGIDDPGPVALSRAVTLAWDTTETPALALDVTVPDDWHVRADEDRLRTILENLFRNAADHAVPADAGADGTAAAESAVTVTVARTDDGFAVADDGTGIPDGERDAVFEQGYSTAGDGTGFGLAIVRDIARAHGWSVTVDESVAGGARFTFTDVTVAEPPD